MVVWWMVWKPTVIVCTLTAIIVIAYIAGLRRPAATKRRRMQTRRIISFLLGVCLVFIALQSPIEYLSEGHFFLFQQLQHFLLLMMAAPLLIVSDPLATLLRGSPRFPRRWVVRAVMRQPALRAVYRFLTHPVVAPSLFAGLLVLWNVPAIHDDAVVHAGTRDFMQFSLLFGGLIFWRVIFDLRPRALKRVSYGKRAAILCAVQVPVNVLGATLADTHHMLYGAYDQFGGAWGITPLNDQLYGAMILWLPGALAEFVAFLVIMVLWARSERRLSGASPPGQFVVLRRPQG